jgi:hypothetical protein
MSATAPNLPDDVVALRALVLEQHAELALARSGLVEQRYEIEALKVRLAKLLRAVFGQSSEKLRSDIEQLELLLAEQQEQAAETDTTTEPNTDAKDNNKPVRAPLPEALSREIIEHAAPCAANGGWPACGGRLHPLGTNATEILDYIPGGFRVVRHVLAPGLGRTKTGRIWTYVRDDPRLAARRRQVCSIVTPPIARASTRGEAEMTRDIDQAAVVDDQAVGILDDHCGLHAIVEDLPPRAADRGEGGAVATQHGLQVLVNNEAGPDQPREAEHHREQSDDAPDAGLVCEHHLKAGKVDLPLFARRRLKPHLEAALRFRPDLLPRALDRGVAAGEAALAQLPQEPDGA